jgi:hypothetical protein
MCDTSLYHNKDHIVRKWELDLVVRRNRAKIKAIHI